jgi:hypothetical protein
MSDRPPAASWALATLAHSTVTRTAARVERVRNEVRDRIITGSSSLENEGPDEKSGEGNENGKTVTEVRGKS